MTERVPKIKENNIDSYVDYVTYYISLLSKYEDLIKDNSISFHDVNYLLANHLKVLNVLTSEYHRKLYEYDNVKNEFDMWWDEVFVEERNIHNTPELPNSKWLGLKELESLARVNNKDEYLDKRKVVDTLELRVKFLERLMKNWENAVFTMNILSKNMQVEWFGTKNVE